MIGAELNTGIQKEMRRASFADACSSAAHPHITFDQSKIKTADLIININLLSVN
jgi:hypothetical protein